jgi:hypothetical protein
VRGTISDVSPTGSALAVPASIAVPAAGTYRAELELVPSGEVQQAVARIANPGHRPAEGFLHVALELPGEGVDGRGGLPLPASHAHLRFVSAAGKPLAPAPAPAVRNVG